MTNPFRNHYTIVCTLLTGIALFTSGPKPSVANSLFVWDNKVYVAGIQGTEAFIWENETSNILSANGSVNTIFVTNK